MVEVRVPHRDIHKVFKGIKEITLGMSSFPQAPVKAQVPDRLLQNRYLHFFSKMSTTTKEYSWTVHLSSKLFLANHIILGI